MTGAYHYQHRASVTRLHQQRLNWRGKEWSAGPAQPIGVPNRWWKNLIVYGVYFVSSTFEPLITSLQAWLELLDSLSSFQFMVHLSSLILLVCPQGLCGMLSNKQLFTQFFFFFHPRSYLVPKMDSWGLDTSLCQPSHRRYRMVQPFPCHFELSCQSSSAEDLHLPNTSTEFLTMKNSK